MRAVTVFAALVVVLFSGCSNGQPEPEKSPLSQKVGQNCSVQFRRGDALGAGGGLPVSPNADITNGTEVSITGKLRAVTGGWIMIESGGGTEYCIPVESILLVRFSK
jgi:hypothetical protein